MRRYTFLALSLILSGYAFAQHDPGRDAVRLLAQDKKRAGIECVNKSMKGNIWNSPVSRAERDFVMAMLTCKQNKLDEALDYAKKAVANGLPIERFRVGPRDIFAPLYAHPPFQEWMKTHTQPLLQGPLLGSVTDSKASFWVRTEKETEVQIIAQQLSKTDEKQPPITITGKAKTSRADDFTTIVHISGLKPDTAYHYEVMVNGQKTTAAAEFRTFPKQGRPAAFKIAFGGGAGFTPKHEHMWTTIAKHSPRALLLLGDNVYIDDPTHALTQRYCYYRRQSQPEWKQLTASTSVFSIYDDHDFGVNDCIPGPDIEKPAWKRNVWEIFKQNWNNPSYGGGEKQPGCWYDFQMSEVQFIMLDCRYYRDFKGKSMLGPVQKKWLFDTLKASNSKFKVLVSSVPWAPGVKPSEKGGYSDTWDGFSPEREEIFSFIEKSRIEGVILMSADRHRSDLRKIKRPNGYDLYDVMSSRLTNVHTHPLTKNAKGSEFIMGYNKKCSFGLMEFDTTQADPQVKFSIVNIDNEVIDSRTIKSSQLKFGEVEK